MIQLLFWLKISILAEINVIGELFMKFWFYFVQILIVRDW